MLNFLNKITIKEKVFLQRHLVKKKKKVEEEKKKWSFKTAGS